MKELNLKLPAGRWFNVIMTYSLGKHGEDRYKLIFRKDEFGFEFGEWSGFVSFEFELD